MDLLDLFDRGSRWTASKIPGAVMRLDEPTRCPDWNVRDLLNHLVDSQRYFEGAARGEDAPLPNPSPPDLVGDDPVRVYEQARQRTLDAFRPPEVLEKMGPALGLAFADQVIHGSVLAAATGQDATIDEELAAAALAMIDGRLTDENRGNGFAPAVEAPAGATAHERLLAFSGRRV